MVCANGMSTRQERALNARKQRGIECVVGALVDLTFIADVLGSADAQGQTFQTVCQLGQPGDHLLVSPPGGGDFALVQIMIEGGSIDTGDEILDAAQYLYVGDIRSGDTKDGRDVWGGSTGSPGGDNTNRTHALQLTPDSRLYVNTDPLRVAGLREFSEKQPLKVAMGSCRTEVSECVAFLMTFECMGPS